MQSAIAATNERLDELVAQGRFRADLKHRISGVVIAVPLLALNLRPAVTSMGSVLANIRSDTGMSAALASAVVAAPVWCFAAGGGLAWAMRVRFGTTRTVAIALTALMIALAGRVAAGPYVLLAGTVAACLAIAVLGTLLPAIVHAAPARGWAMLTGCYVAALGSGSAVGALVTPEITDHTSWKIGARRVFCLDVPWLRTWTISFKCVGWLVGRRKLRTWSSKVTRPTLSCWCSVR